MYIECISCPKMGVTCDGPNYAAIPAHDLLEWCRLRKNHLGWSNSKLAEEAGIAKGTVDRLFAAERVDFKYDTICPIIKALVGGTWVGKPCAELRQQDSHLAETIQRLEEENSRLREDDETRVDFLKEQLRLAQETSAGRKTAIVVLAVLLGTTLALIIAALIIDRLNPNIGFFWLERLAGAVGKSVIGNI